MKPLICDLPYPSVDAFTPDVRSGQILSFAYATLNGEVTATLQYAYHNFVLFDSQPEIAETLLSIAVAEMHHISLLGKAMYRLGVKPLYTQYPNSKNYYNTSCISQSVTPTKILIDNLKGELNAISEYRKILLVLDNEQVQALVERIILDEQLHVETLKKLMEKLNTPNENID